MTEKKDIHSGRVCWQCPSNIALVKYWGKKPGQIPANPSLSMTLSHAYTEMAIEFSPAEEMNVEFFFEGARKEDFGRKIETYLTERLSQLPFLKQLQLTINSRNTFPHSTGIASSASSMGALGLCLADMKEIFSEQPLTANVKYRLASSLARLASGSACRSVYGHYTIWGRHEEISGTSDEYAIPVPFQVHPEFQEMGDAILVVSSREKTVSSRAGHSLMDGHPYAIPRYQEALKNMSRLSRAMESGDMETFVRITENEALNLHGLMMSSGQSYLLIEPATVNIVNSIRHFRMETSIPVCFTLDAGPNVHLIYPLKYREETRKFITGELLPYLEKGNWIDDKIGDGPVCKTVGL